jgi:hypothetical protein
MDDNSRGELNIRGTKSQKTPKKEGFSVLVAQITFDCYFAKKLDRRSKKVWRSFYENKQILCAKQATIPQKLSLFVRLVSSTFLWGAKVW